MKIIRTESVKNEEALHNVKEEKTILYAVNVRKVNWSHLA